MYNTLGIELIHPFKEKFSSIKIPRIQREQTPTTTTTTTGERKRMVSERKQDKNEETCVDQEHFQVRRKVTRLFRNNPEEYYLPEQCSWNNQQITNDISRGNEENLKRLRGLFVDFDQKRAQVTTNVDLFQDEFIKFRCDSCGESFNNRMAMKTHKIIKHIVQRVYECESCTRLFAFKESLTVHRRTCRKEEDLKPATKKNAEPQQIQVNFMLDFSSIKVNSPSPDHNKTSLTCSDCGGSFAKRALLIWHQRHVCK